MNSGKLALEIARRKGAEAEDSAALKAELRREDQAMARDGRAYEVLKRNVGALGIDLERDERPRLLSINGVRFRK